MTKEVIETSKGRFLVNEEGKGISLKEITENQASEIVEDTNNIQPWTYKYYGYANQICFTAIESLHSLLKSKGIKITNNTYIFKL